MFHRRTITSVAPSPTSRLLRTVMPGHPDVPRHLEGPERPRTPLHRRLLHKFQESSVKKKTNPAAVNWKAFHPNNVALHLSQDPQPEHNAIHRLLPEEHRASLQPPPQVSLPKSPQELHCPVPRRHNTPDPNHRQSSTDKLERFKADMALTFLSELERKILHSMRRIRRSSFFRPLLDPTRPVLLVHPDDIAPLQIVRDSIQTFPSEEEKLAVPRSLGPFLAVEQVYVLKLLLSHPELQIRSNTLGTGVESPELVRRPRSAEFFGYVMDLHYDKDPKDVRYENEGVVGKGKERKRESEGVSLSQILNKRRTFEVRSEVLPEGAEVGARGALPGEYFVDGRGHNAIREFQGPYGRDWPPSYPQPSGLRGGGDDDSPAPARTTAGIFSAYFFNKPLPRLSDSECVPRGLYWLAGGNTRKGPKTPTGKELRERKAAEQQNRDRFGFWGTVRGKSVEEAKEETGKSSEDEEDRDDRVYPSGASGPKSAEGSKASSRESPLHIPHYTPIQNQERTFRAVYIIPRSTIPLAHEKSEAKAGATQSTEEKVAEWLESKKEARSQDGGEKASGSKKSASEKVSGSEQVSSKGGSAKKSAAAQVGKEGSKEASSKGSGSKKSAAADGGKDGSKKASSKGRSGKKLAAAQTGKDGSKKTVSKGSGERASGSVISGGRESGIHKSKAA